MECLSHTVKFGEEPITGRLYDPTTVLCHSGINDFDSITPEPRKRTDFVSLHEPGKAHHISRKDGSEPPLW
jgi:hypothetical protein